MNKDFKAELRPCEYGWAWRVTGSLDSSGYYIEGYVFDVGVAESHAEARMDALRSLASYEAQNLTDGWVPA